MELLFGYFSSTVIEWRAVVYSQKPGVCIGSRVAPILSEIFLSKVNRLLEPILEGVAEKKIEVCR